MSLLTDLEADGIGAVLRVSFSYDRFATVALRVATAAGTYDGVNQWSSKLLTATPIRRGFGQSRIATGGTIELMIDNVDGSLDQLVGRENLSNLAKLRARIYVTLFNPAFPDFANQTHKMLGEFSLVNWPEQSTDSIRMTLGDDVLGTFSQQVFLPTIADWQAVGTTSNNPIKTSVGMPSSIDLTTSIQLAFGEDWVNALPHLLPWNTPITTGDPSYFDSVIVPVCSTTDLSPANDALISNLRIYWFALDEVIGDSWAGAVEGQVELGLRWTDIPRVVKVSDALDYLGTPAEYQTVWRVEKSPTITKNGIDFQIVYLVVRGSLGGQIFIDGGFSNGGEGRYKYAAGYPSRAVDFAPPNTQTYAQRVISWYVKGPALSARTRGLNPQHATDVLSDFAAYYTYNPSPSIDTARRTRVRSGNPNAIVAGVVQSWSEGPRKGDVNVPPPPSLRQVITKICQSSDLDIFINWSGQLSFSADLRDYTTASQLAGLPLIDEKEFLEPPKRWLPSNGERGAVFNRLYLEGGRTNPPDQEGIPYQGPWDFDSGAAGFSPVDRVVEAKLEQGWRPWRQQSQSPLMWRSSLDLTARDRFKFRMGRRGLEFELGDLVRVNWSRGFGGPYSQTVLQIEAITFAYSDFSVEIEAIWRGDLDTERAYLLDDESFAIRSKNVGTPNAYPNAGSDTCNFDAGLDLNSMGVQAGDILVFQDASEPENEFAANRCFRISNVGSATQLSVDGAGFSDPMPSPFIFAVEWQIYRGATTYPTAVSDPVLYPDGSDMYGKVTNAAGNYTNAVQGNRIY